MIFLTGATGFVGRALSSNLVRKGLVVKAVVRELSDELSSEVKQIKIDDLTELSGEETRRALKGVKAVVHMAAITYLKNNNSLDSLKQLHSTNVDATLNLARHAAAAGVKRFIFLSSVKVNGEETAPGEKFSAEDTSAPEDPYAVSKMQAENGLRKISSDTGLEIVIIRPPLIYGPGVKGNFRSMMHWISKGIPLPLGAIRNHRSLIALDNLVDFITTCIEHPAAANQLFLVADGEDLSTSELLRRVGDAMNKPTQLVYVPVSWLKFGAALLGKRAIAQRLCGNLQVDSTKARRMLDWTPPLHVYEGLKKAVSNDRA